MTDLLREKAESIKQFLDDHKGIDTRIIDVSQQCSWADCFIVTTVSSLGHLRGLARELWDELYSLNLSVSNRHKAPGDDGWELVDCNDIVINLMSQEMRQFYNLEKLWDNAGN